MQKIIVTVGDCHHVEIEADGVSVSHEGTLSLHRGLKEVASFKVWLYWQVKV